MAIKTIHGDIWEQARGVLVHGCNAQGKMGAGAAKTFAEKFPKAFAQYRQAWRDGQLKLGEVIFCELGPDLWGACAITQEHYGSYGGKRVHADLPAIEAAFEKVARFAEEKSLPVSFIRVGAGHARGDWAKIEPVIHRALGSVGGTLVEWDPSAASAPAASLAAPAAAKPQPALGAQALSPGGSAAAKTAGSFKWGQKRS